MRRALRIGLSVLYAILLLQSVLYIGSSDDLAPLETDLAAFITLFFAALAIILVNRIRLYGIGEIPIAEEMVLSPALRVLLVLFFTAAAVFGMYQSMSMIIPSSDSLADEGNPAVYMGILLLILRASLLIMSYLLVSKMTLEDEFE